MTTGDLQKQTMDLLVNDNLSFEKLKDRLLPILNEYRYQNSQSNNQDFEGFTDSMMLAYYLLRDTHVNSQRGKSDNTLKAYREVLTYFYDSCFANASAIGVVVNDLPVDSHGNVSLYKGLNRIHIENYCKWLPNAEPMSGRKEKYAAASVSQKLTIIKGFFKKLYEWGYIDTPLHVSFLSMTLSKHDRPNRDMTPEQVVALLDIFKEYNQLMFCLIQVFTTTGIRNNELCKLRVVDLQYDAASGLHFLRINAKGNKDREVPIREKTLACIRKFRHIRGVEPFEKVILTEPEAPLFTTRSGKAYTPSYLVQYFKTSIDNLPAEQKAILDEKLSYYAHRVPGDRNSGIVRKVLDVTPHVFRHAFAIASKRSGIDIDTIQRSLGHADRKTTEIYLESIIQKEDHAIHRWNGEILGDYI